MTELATTLTACEAVIERGMKTFIEVGRALATVRDDRLYRDQHDTFEDYCQQRWNLSRSRAYRMIDATELVDAMSPMGDTAGSMTASIPRPARSYASMVEKLDESDIRVRTDVLPGTLVVTTGVLRLYLNPTTARDLAAKITAALAGLDEDDAQ